MAKHVFDKYYTPVSDAKRLIETTLRVLRDNNYLISEVIEPSAGNGSFSHQIDCIAYDIEPEADDIIKADFLTLPLEYKKGRLFIGNPPFGTRNTLSLSFYKKCCQCGDYIAFVQPISQYNNNYQMYDFDLLYSEDLGVVEWSGHSLHCCFNIYVRPTSGQLNPKPCDKLKAVEIVNLRRFKQPQKEEYIKTHPYDLGICAFGASAGKPVEHVGQYVNELYFYIKKPQYREKILGLLTPDKIRSLFPDITVPSISIGRLYKYIKDNVEGIE